MLAIPPFGASSNIALWRANNKPPLEVVVANLEVKLKNFEKNKYNSNNFAIVFIIANLHR